MKNQVEGLRELVERKRAYYGKFTGNAFGETNKILAAHVLEFCNELAALLAATSPEGEQIAGRKARRAIISGDRTARDDDEY